MTKKYATVFYHLAFVHILFRIRTNTDDKKFFVAQFIFTSFNATKIKTVMREKLFQFIWQFRLYDQTKPLITIDNQEIFVLHPGKLNRDAGPDFFEAKIKINQTTWVGNIELHLKSSDWNKHLHQENNAYSNLILHVVYTYDEDIQTFSDSIFPTLELKDHVDLMLLHKYESLMNNKQFIPCASAFEQVPLFIIQQQLDRMLAERLEEKVQHIQTRLIQYNNNWQDVFYILLARGFGLHINQDAFEMLALQTPLSLFAKYKNNLLKIEALLFGQAGFLNDYFDEPYPILLQKEYAHVKELHKLTPIAKENWKFLRLRPANFPLIRIAEFAQVLYLSSHLFSKVLEAKTIKEIEKLFQFAVSDYWLSHYTFQEKSIERNLSLGNSFIHTIIINTIIPSLFIYGRLHGKEQHCHRALEMLRELKPEKNSILQGFQRLNFTPQHAADTQALLQLKKQYCDKKRCLDCSIGYRILKRE